MGKGKRKGGTVGFLYVMEVEKVGDVGQDWEKEGRGSRQL